VTRHDHDSHLISISRISRAEGTEVSILRLRGAVRGPTSSDFRSRLDDAGRLSPLMVVDLSELEYINSTGMGMLLDQARIQKRRDGWLRLVAPQGGVSMILRVAGVDEELRLFGDEAEALRDLEKAA
jgi:anti-sigma B factor antagonist